jgi:hypothetical protein
MRAQLAARNVPLKPPYEDHCVGIVDDFWRCQARAAEFPIDELGFHDRAIAVGRPRTLIDVADNSLTYALR